MVNTILTKNHLVRFSECTLEPIKHCGHIFFDRLRAAFPKSGEVTRVATFVGRWSTVRERKFGHSLVDFFRYCAELVGRGNNLKSPSFSFGTEVFGGAMFSGLFTLYCSFGYACTAL